MLTYLTIQYQFIFLPSQRLEHMLESAGIINSSINWIVVTVMCKHKPKLLEHCFGPSTAEFKQFTIKMRVHATSSNTH